MELIHRNQITYSRVITIQCELQKKHIDTKSYSLENLAYMVGITRAESHRAADDCIMTLEFLNRLEIILNNE